MQALNEWVKRTIGMRDEEGRPLGEAKAPPERLRGVPLELRTCPYADSRKNHALPMNVSALKQAFAHWDGVLGGIELLRSLYTAEVNLKQIRLIDVWRIGVLTSSIGDFAFLRAENPVGDLELPAPVAAVYKISLGIASTCVAMWADGSSRFDAPADADALYAYADANGQFIGSEQVCAGPLGMVKQTLRLVVDGTGARGDPSAAARVIGDSRRFLQFSRGVASLRLLRMAQDRLDSVLGSNLVWTLTADPAAPALPEIVDAVRHNSRLGRFLNLNDGARLDVLDELLTHAADPRLAGVADLEAGIRRVRAAWTRPVDDAGATIQPLVDACPRTSRLHPETRSAIARQLARFCWMESGFAELVCLLKERIADALGVELSHPRAGERHLVHYVPSGVLLVRTILRDALDIEVRREGGRLFLVCGGLSCEPTPLHTRDMRPAELVKEVR